MIVPDLFGTNNSGPRSPTIDALPTGGLPPSAKVGNPLTLPTNWPAVPTDVLPKFLKEPPKLKAPAMPWPNSSNKPLWSWFAAILAAVFIKWLAIELSIFLKASWILIVPFIIPVNDCSKELDIAWDNATTWDPRSSNTLICWSNSIVWAFIGSAKFNFSARFNLNLSISTMCCLINAISSSTFFASLNFSPKANWSLTLSLSNFNLAAVFISPSLFAFIIFSVILFSWFFKSTTLKSFLTFWFCVSTRSVSSLFIFAKSFLSLLLNFSLIFNRTSSSFWFAKAFLLASLFFNSASFLFNCKLNFCPSIVLPSLPTFCCCCSLNNWSCKPISKFNSLFNFLASAVLFCKFLSNFSKNLSITPVFGNISNNFLKLEAKLLKVLNDAAIPAEIAPIAVKNGPAKIPNVVPALLTSSLKPALRSCTDLLISRETSALAPVLFCTSFAKAALALSASPNSFNNSICALNSPLIIILCSSSFSKLISLIASPKAFALFIRVSSCAPIALPKIWAPNSSPGFAVKLPANEPAIEPTPPPNNKGKPAPNNLPCLCCLAVLDLSLWFFSRCLAKSFSNCTCVFNCLNSFCTGVFCVSWSLLFTFCIASSSSLYSLLPISTNWIIPFNTDLYSFSDAIVFGIVLPIFNTSVNCLPIPTLDPVANFAFVWYKLLKLLRRSNSALSNWREAFSPAINAFVNSLLPTLALLATLLNPANCELRPPIVFEKPVTLPTCPKVAKVSANVFFTAFICCLKASVPPLCFWKRSGTGLSDFITPLSLLTFSTTLSSCLLPVVFILISTEYATTKK